MLPACDRALMLGSARILYFPVMMTAALAAACGTSGTTSLTPTAPSVQRCLVTMTLSNSTLSSAGGTGTISVVTARECQWTLTAQSDWVKFGSATNGQGPADVPFTVHPNRSTSAR